MISPDPVAMKCRPYAARFLRRFRHTTYTPDDLVQDCWVAYLQGKGYYHRRMVDAMRRWHEAGTGWEHFPMPNMCSETHIPERSSSTMERDFEEAEVRELVGAAVDSLPDLERLVVRLYFWEGKPLHVIGLVIGRCEARASQLKSSGLQRLAKRLRLPHPH